MDSSDSSWQILFQPWLVKKTSHVHEASPGTHTFFPSYTCHIYCKRFRAVIGLRLVLQSHPRLQPLYGFCPSGQRFAAGFLQIPRHQGHPCLWLYPSHCRVDSGLSPVRTCARRAHQKSDGTGTFTCSATRLCSATIPTTHSSLLPHPLPPLVSPAHLQLRQRQLSASGCTLT